ncbi:MAG TPA: sucrase ferredoxin [Pyrinomonadaceae bacterium]
MKQDIFYCAALSTEVKEQVLGTASTCENWLLLEYREGWGVEPFKESDLPRNVKQHLSRSLKSVVKSRLLFIKQDPQTTRRLAMFVARSMEVGSTVVKYEFNNYEDLRDLDLTAALSGQATTGATQWNSPLFLVCTHGRRDKCCAKFGFPIYKSTRDFANDDSVWQSSHVGGDRFAANMICFPDGLFYGHVTEDTAPLIVSAYREKQLFLDRLRGRTCYARPIQAAEVFVRQQSGLSGLTDLKFLDYEVVKPNYFRVRFLSQDESEIHELYLTSQLSEFQNRLTCHSAEEKKVVQYLPGKYSRVII